MKKTPKFKVGDTILYKEKYWTKLFKATITLIGTQGSTIVYGLTLDNGASSYCREQEIVTKV